MPSGRELYEQYQRMKTGAQPSGKDLYAQYQAMKGQQPASIPMQTPPPAPVSSTYVDVPPVPINRGQGSPDTIGQQEYFPASDPGARFDAKKAGVSDTILKDLAFSIAEFLRPEGSIERVGLDAIKQAETLTGGLPMPEDRTFASNIGRGVSNLLPYLVSGPAGGARFGLDVVKHPGEMIESMGESYRNIMGATRTTGPALDLVSLFAKARGIPEVWGALPDNVKKEILDREAKSGQAAIGNQLIETLLSAAAPLMIATGAGKAMKLPAKTPIGRLGRWKVEGMREGVTPYEPGRVKGGKVVKKAEPLPTKVPVSDKLQMQSEAIKTKGVATKENWQLTWDEYATKEKVGSYPLYGGQKRWWAIDVMKAVADGKKVKSDIVYDAAGELKGEQKFPNEIIQKYPRLVEFEKGKSIPRPATSKPGDVTTVPDLAKPGAGNIELGFMGMTPQTFRALGQTGRDAVSGITKTTNEIIQKTKMKPEIKAGVEDALGALIEHDRAIRNGEFLRHQFTKVINDVVPNKERQMLMVHAYEQKMRGKYWDQLNDLEKSMVEWAGKEKGKLNRFIDENQVLERMEEKDVNHVYHHWIDSKTGKPYQFTYGKFSKGLPQAKQRAITTYESGIGKGLKPATTNLGELIGMEWESVLRAGETRNAFKTLHNIGAEKGVNIQLMKGKSPKPIRMVESWSKLAQQGLTEDYMRYDHPALDKAFTFKDVNGNMVRMKGAVGVRKELYHHLRAYMENPKYGTLDQLNFAAKSLKLGGNMFHAMMLGAQEVANFRVPFKNIPRGLRLRKQLNDPVIKLLHQEGLDLFKGYEDLGYRNSFFEGSNVVGKAGNVVTWPIVKMRDFIFEVVQPGMKTSFAYDKYHKLLPKMLKEGKTEAEVARAAVKMADGHFSGEHYKRSLLETNRFMAKMYFSPEARRGWQALLLSPTWQREHLLVAKDVGKSFVPNSWLKKAGLTEMTRAERLEYQKYALGAVMMVGAVDLYNYLITQEMDGEGKHIWQNPEGRAFAVRAPWNEPSYETTTSNGQVRKYAGGKGYFRPLKSVYEVAEWVHDPVQKWSYKLSPAITAIGQQIWPSKYQKEYRGWPDMPRRVTDFLIDVGEPISVNQFKQWFEGKKSAPGAIAPFFGFPTSKVKDKTIEDIRREIAKIKKQGK